MMDALKNLPQTFYSQSFYRDLIRRRQGYGGGYILLLIILLCLQMTASMYAPVQKIYTLIPEFLTAMPEMTISDGKLTGIDKPMPYSIKMEPDNASSKTIVIDTNQVMDDREHLAAMMEKQNIFILIAAEKMAVFHSGQVDINELNLQEIGATVTRAHWVAFSDTIRSFIYPIFAVFVLTGAACAGLLRAFLGGLIPMLLTRPFKTQMDYKGGVRLATTTAIPCAVFLLLLPLHGGTFYALWLMYILFALWSDKMLSATGQEKI